MRRLHYFVCATNRPWLGKNGQTLEVLMYNQRCAAIWEYPKDTGKTVHHLTHMQRVQGGDLIFMALAVQLSNEWSASLVGGNGSSREQGRRCAEHGLIPQ